MDANQATELIKRRVERLQEQRSFESIADAAMRTAAGAGGTGAFQTFQEVVSKDGLSVIGRVFAPGAEGASPDIDDEEAIELAYEYDAGDADAVAFVESIFDLDRSAALFKEMRDEVSTPLLCSGLIVDPYQLCEAKFLGADAVTLVADALDDKTLERFLGICDQLMMDAVVEASSLEGIARAKGFGAYIVSASIDSKEPGSPSLEDMRSAAGDVLLVLSGGIDSVDDALCARNAGIDAVIAGDFLVKCYREDTMREAIRAMRE